MHSQNDIELSPRRPAEHPGRLIRDTMRLRKMAVTERPILIVEDEYLIAADLASQISEDGGRVIGPAHSMHDARVLLRESVEIGCAILDVKLDQHDTFELADALMNASIPFVFYTGYRSVVIPDRFIGIPRIVKPAGWRQVKQGLAVAIERLNNTGMGSFRNSIEAALPQLRRQARLLVTNPEDADRLVEATLERAISAVAGRSLQMTIEDWLTSLLLQSAPDGSKRILH